MTEINTTDDEVAKLMSDIDAMVARAPTEEALKAAEPKKRGRPAKAKEPEPVVEEAPVAFMKPDQVELDKGCELPSEAGPGEGAGYAEPVEPVSGSVPDIDDNVDPAPERVAEAQQTPEGFDNARASLGLDDHGLSKIKAGLIETGMTEVPKQSTQRPKQELLYFIDVDKFRSDTQVTFDQLDGAMIQQAGLRAYYSAQAAEAEGQHSRLKVQFEVLEAKLYDEHRTLLTQSEAKVTEKMVENAVKLDPRWLAGKTKVIRAETIATTNKGLVASIADRKDMIVQLGADRREELKGDVRTMAKEVNSRFQQ